MNIAEFLKLEPQERDVNNLELNVGKYVPKDISPVGLPPSMRFGIELETEGVAVTRIDKLIQTGELKVICERLGISDELFFKHNIWVKPDPSYSSGEERDSYYRWTLKSDPTLTPEDNTEAASPILQDNEISWNEVGAVCHLLKALGAKATSRCGFHIHIGAKYLKCDGQAWENLFRIFGETEELVSKISNAENDIMRVGVMTYAQPITKTIQEVLSKGSIQLKCQRDLDELSMAFKRNDIGKKASLNLINISNANKNTIEYRTPNGTIDLETIRQTVALSGAILKTALEHSENPEHKHDEFESLFERGIPEREKLNRFLSLIFETEEQKEIYRRRWESVKHSAVYDIVAPRPRPFEKDKSEEMGEQR